MVNTFGRQKYAGEIQWIAPAGSEKVKGCVFRARREFDYNHLAENPIIYIAAESYYALYFNGEHIGSGPARGTENCNFIDVYNVAEYLRKGRNIVAVEVFCNNFGTFMAAPSQPALFIKTGNFVCDDKWQVQIAQEYRTADVPDYTPQIGLMEWRDLRKSPRGWQLFNDLSQWLAAEVIDKNRKIYSKSLFIRDIVPLSKSEKFPAAIPIVKTVKHLDNTDSPDVATILDNEQRFETNIDLSRIVNRKPVEILPRPDNGGVVFIADFGDEFIGFFELDIDAPQGTIVDVGYQEVIEGDKLNLSMTEACVYRFADRYILADGRQCLNSPLRCRGGRFMQLTLRNFDRPITIHSLKVADVRYPINNAAKFDCSDEFYNELWQRSLNTLSCCATDTILDCPWREMSFWVNDFVVVNRYWLQMTGGKELSRRCISLALSQRRADGLIPGVCPYDGNPKVVLFATNLFMPLILRDYLEYTGDFDYMRQVVDEIGDIVEKCKKFSDADGLLTAPDEYWNFVDWSYELNNISLNGRNSCVVNWFYVCSLSALGDLYKRIDEDKSRQYKIDAKNIALRIEAVFWNSGQGCFNEYASADSPAAGLLTHSLALLSGYLSRPVREKAAQALFRDDLPVPELYMLHFVIEAMVMLGKPRHAQELIYKYWKPIIDSGCPTIWEMNVHQHGKSAISNCGSLCHAFSLAPVNYLQRHVLGLIPHAEMDKTFLFSPSLGSLSYVRGSVSTDYGSIYIECKRSGQNLQTQIDIPENLTVILPNGKTLGPGRHKQFL